MEGCSVDCDFHVWKDVVPSAATKIGCAEYGLKGLIGALCQTVGLWVKCGRWLVYDSQSVAELLPPLKSQFVVSV